MKNASMLKFFWHIIIFTIVVNQLLLLLKFEGNITPEVLHKNQAIRSTSMEMLQLPPKYQILKKKVLSSTGSLANYNDLKYVSHASQKHSEGNEKRIPAWTNE